MDEPSLFLSLLPFPLIGMMFFFFAIPISRRKGKGVALPHGV